MGKFKKMMNSSLLLERIDYIDTAKQLIKKYNLRSKVKIINGKKELINLQIEK